MLLELLDAMAARLGNELQIQVSPRVLADPSPPCAHIFPAEISYHATMEEPGEESASWPGVTVQAFAALTSDIGAQTILLELLDDEHPRCMRKLIERRDADGAMFGGVVDDLIVTGATGLRQYIREGRAPMLGAEWTVRILT